ncbi:MAG TPA: TetR family transcriptional regulator [Pseudonocardiaceae bacterium]
MVVAERSRLTRQTVVEHALALADAEGLDAVTIRRLAERLGVTPMALYWHVKNKDELLSAMADALLTEVTPEREPGQPWHVQLRAMVTALLRVMRVHPCAPALLATADKAQAASFTRATDTALDLLGKAGFTPQEGYLIASQVLHDMIGLVDRQPICAPGPDDRQAAELRRQHRLAMLALPIAEYPRLVEYAGCSDMDPEAYFEFGVDLLMAGLEAMAARRPAASTPS